jgi:hypothetical protein
MGHWGVKSYENDDADDALDAAFDRVHSSLYENLMDDGNPLSFEQVQKRLANGRTLGAAVAFLEESVGEPVDGRQDSWDEIDRLALVGVVVRQAELGVEIPETLRDRALDWLEHEVIDWDEATKRKLRREKEISLLRRQGAESGRST